MFRPPGGIRLLGFDCRAHGQTHPLGPPEKISLQSFADDLLALMDFLQIEKAVVGGISMGAAVALNFVLRHPHRALGLVLDRPAWLDTPRRDNMAFFTVIADLLRRHGPQKGLELFKQTDTYQSALAASPTTAASLAGQFLQPQAQERVARLERIPLDCPAPDRRQWRAIAVPTLVLANGRDAIHPLEYGVTLAREIPGAEFKELTPKSRQRRTAPGGNATLPGGLPPPSFLTAPHCLMLKCSTSLWSADLGDLAREMKRVEPYSERFHLDVADGHYVKTLLFFPDLVRGLAPPHAPSLRGPSHGHRPPGLGGPLGRGRGRRDYF